MWTSLLASSNGPRMRPYSMWSYQAIRSRRKVLMPSKPFWRLIVARILSLRISSWWLAECLPNLSKETTGLPTLEPSIWTKPMPSTISQGKMWSDICRRFLIKTGRTQQRWKCVFRRNYKIFSEGKRTMHEIFRNCKINAMSWSSKTGTWSSKSIGPHPSISRCKEIRSCIWESIKRN